MASIGSTWLGRMLGFGKQIDAAVNEAVTEAMRGKALAGPPAPAAVARAGYEYGVPPGGMTVNRQAAGAATQTDRRSNLSQLYDAYLTCPWSWAAVQAIARTITAGGVVAEWNGDDGEGDDKAPPKPPSVLAMERLFQFVNPREDIRQLMRGVIIDLLVFGDAYIEVVWIGSLPVALYSLDSPTMFPEADEHGQISGYWQVTEFGQRAKFEEREVIHISLDSPRSGIFGISPTQAAMLPITAWLYAAACLKELFRKGNPPNVHVDLPASMQPAEIAKWDMEYQVRNIGPRNIGNPIITKGGGKVDELQQGQLSDYMAMLDQKRDEILAQYGVPPAKAGVIESGNLGGGTGEAQDKTFHVNTCDPLAELIMEKINYHLGVQGFGVMDWHFRFGSIDMRDSKTVEEIRDMRLRAGAYTLNRYRAEIGEPPVDGGDEAVLVDKQNLVLWRDLATMSDALIAKAAGTAGLELEEPGGEGPTKLVKPEPQPVPAALAAGAALGPDGQPLPPGQQPPAAPGKAAAKPPAAPAQDDEEKPPAGKGKAGKATKESGLMGMLGEAWAVEYNRRLNEALGAVGEHAAYDGDSHTDHDHHNHPDYEAADLGVGELTAVVVDPGTLRVDHTNYQRPRDDQKVERLAQLGAQALEARYGLLARRPDGSRWIVDGQHHTAAAVVLGIPQMRYQEFESTGPLMERRVFEAWQTWDRADNPALRGYQPVTAGAMA